jgi:hypothetical protein
MPTSIHRCQKYLNPSRDPVSLTSKFINLLTIMLRIHSLQLVQKLSRFEEKKHFIYIQEESKMVLFAHVSKMFVFFFEAKAVQMKIHKLAVAMALC